MKLLILSLLFLSGFCALPVPSVTTISLTKRGSESVELIKLRNSLKTVLQEFSPPEIKGSKTKPIRKGLPELVSINALRDFVDEMTVYFGGEAKPEKVKGLSDIILSVQSQPSGSRLEHLILQELRTKDNSVAKSRYIITQAFERTNFINFMMNQEKYLTAEKMNELTAKIFMADLNGAIPPQHHKTVIRILFKKIQALPLKDQSELLQKVITSVQTLPEDLAQEINAALHTSIQNLYGPRKEAFEELAIEKYIKEASSSRVGTPAHPSKPSRWSNPLSYLKTFMGSSSKNVPHTPVI